MAGFEVSSAYVGETGLAHDRQMMLIDEQGRFVTARKFPRLLAFKCVMHEHGVVITSNNSSLKVNYDDFKSSVEVNIWRHDMLAVVANDNINQWFSDALNINVRLVKVSEQSQRTVKGIPLQSVKGSQSKTVKDSQSKDVKDFSHSLAFSDGYPLLIIGEESLELLNENASESSLMSQFRSNLVFSGGEPFIEDTWRRVKIGDVEFEFLKPCERCIMTTVDMTTLAFRKSKEPLRTLATFRADERGRLMFGENLVAKNHGVISIGDTIEVLETHVGVNYGAK